MTKQIKTLLNAAGSFGSGKILEAIGKIAPAVNPFIRGAFVAGYAADQIADFLKNQFSTPEERRNQSQLEERSGQGTARPDERAELSQIEQGQSPLNRISEFGKLGSQAAGYAGSLHAQQQEAEQQQQMQAQLAEQQQQKELQRQQKEQQQEQRYQEATRLQQEQRKKQEEQSAFNRERQLERDLENKKYREASEQRAIEKHKMATERATKPKASETAKNLSPKTVKTLGKPPAEYIDALKEIDELINRLP